MAQPAATGQRASTTSQGTITSALASKPHGTSQPRSITRPHFPDAQPQGAVVIGHSGGGWGTIAYNSIPHSRATALVSMAGGRGQSVTKDGVWLPELGVWRPDLLVDAAGQFGRSATTPMLWVYSENDRYFTPTLASSLYDAFTRNGGKAELDQVAPYSNDGHRFFFGAGGSQVWGPLVESYLARQPAQ